MSREQLLATTFVELADTLVTEFDALDFLHTLVERTVELLEADAVGLIMDDQRGQLQVLATTTHEARVLELFALQNSEGPCLDCFNAGEAVANVDLEEAEARWPRFQVAATEAGYRSAHALPMRLRSQVIGAVSLFCVNQSSLSDDDLAIGQALADVATIGLLHERSVRQGELLAEQLQTALNSRVLIEQAKGALAERTGIEVEDAFAVMRNHSRQIRQPLTNVAASVIDGSIDVTHLLQGERKS